MSLFQKLSDDFLIQISAQAESDEPVWSELLPYWMKSHMLAKTLIAEGAQVEVATSAARGWHGSDTAVGVVCCEEGWLLAGPHPRQADDMAAGRSPELLQSPCIN